ncbi:MAG: carboxymuconolactone decarboxylase family protein [Mariprofundaceae bacterium]
MDIKMKELIAIGASVTANCVPCLTFHVTTAREAGVSDGEIKQAIDVGRMVRKGAAHKWDEEADLMLKTNAVSGTNDPDQHSCS